MKDTPFVAIDCIVFGFDQKEEALKILLLKHVLESGEITWSLVSGLLNTDESVDDAANRVLHSLTGLTEIYLEQLHASGAVHHGPETRTIAISYYALINQNAVILDDKYSAHWVKLSEKPKLVFDHDEMVLRAVKRLQRRAMTQPIGFKLLPKKFTMRQLIKLYEEILGESLDKRNFAKKVVSMGFLKKLTEKEKESSRKGSYLYKFNAEKFNKGVETGIALQVK
jgi:ADP-ribose pyrophosphatase YjhB (NUDIX family)